MTIFDKIFHTLSLALKFVRQNSPSWKTIFKPEGNVIVGRDIIFEQKTTVVQLSTSQKDRIQRFKHLLDNSAWRSELIDGQEFLFCEEDNDYQIEVGRAGTGEPFSDEWTRAPGISDKSRSYRYPVHLKVGGIKIKEVSFISFDGGRLFLPIPKVKTEGGKRILWYTQDSLVYSLGKRIGRFNSGGSIEKTAQRLGIEIA